MKKLLFTTFLVLIALISNAQDILIMQNGEEIKTTIIEVNESQVKYKLYDDLEGQIYIINRADGFKIKYASGSESVLNERKMVEDVEVNRPSLRQKGLAVRPEIGGKIMLYDYVGEAKLSCDFGLNVMYQFNPKLSIGAGASYDISNDLGDFVPVYFNLRGYFKNRLSSPFYDIRLGYCIPVNERRCDIKTGRKSEYITTKIEGVYLRFGVGMDVYNFYLGIHAGLCAMAKQVYIDSAGVGTFDNVSQSSINQLIFGVNLGYNIQCSKKK